MRRIDQSTLRDDDGSISFQNRLKGTLQYGPNWYGEMVAQDEAFDRLSHTLGAEHIALCNYTLPGTALTIPMVLISPQGVRVIIPSPLRGVYRAKGEEWLKFGGSRSRRFTKARPNLQTRAIDMAQTLHRYLRDQGYALPEVEAVLMFTNPRTHVDTAKPRVRIVQADGIDHYAANLQQFQPIMDMEDINAVLEALLNPKGPELETEPEAADEAVDEEPQPAPPSEAKPVEPAAAALVPRTLRPLTRARFQATRRQWILLGVMAFFEVMILIVLVILVVANTFYG